MVVVIVVIPGGGGGDGKRCRRGRGEERDVGEEVEWPVGCGSPKSQSGAKFIGVDQCSAGRSSNLFNAILQCPKGSSETRAGNRAHDGGSN